jgi:CRISPR-associated protein Cas1
VRKEFVRFAADFGETTSHKKFTPVAVKQSGDLTPEVARMNPLHLNGWGVEIQASNTRTHQELLIREPKTGARYLFAPRQCYYDSIVIENARGHVQLDALRWLSKHNIPIFFLDFNGETISSILPPVPVKADLRIAQIQAATNPEKKLAIAKAFVQGKLNRSLEVLSWLSERYDIQEELRAAKGETIKALRTRTVNELRTVEGRTALRYWETLRKTLPESLHFEGRVTGTHNENANDRFNACLNYSYGFLKVVCRMAINTVGLEPAVGFLHETSSSQTAESLVYDLEEPFRFLCDLCVIEAFESQVFGPYDFAYERNNYLYRIEPEARARLRNRLIEAFNSGVSYHGRILKWDTVIEEKALELSRYLTGRIPTIDFTEPAPNLERTDNRELRAEILSVTNSEARRLGITKQTLFDLRRKAKGEKSFKLYAKVREKLSQSSRDA